MYPDAPSNNEERKQVALIRKALAPLLKDALVNPVDTQPVVERLDALAKAIESSKAQPPAIELTGVEQRLESVEKAVKAIPAVEKVATDVDLSKVEQALSSIAETSKSTEDYQDKVHRLMTKAIFSMAKDRLAGATDRRDPKDYINVRLTDGSEFYRAIDQLATAVAGNPTSFADSSGNPTRAKLDSSGNVVVNVFDSPEVPSNIFRDTFTAQDTANWTFNTAASDLLYNGGNVASSDYLSIAKSALVADTYTELISINSWPLSVLASAGLSLSQRIAAQAFAFDIVACDANGNVLSTARPVDVALANTAAVASTTNILTYTTATSHNLLPGDTIVISGCTDPRLNLGEIVVTGIPTATTFTVTSPATIANGNYTVGTAGLVRFQMADNFATYMMGHYFVGTSATNDSSISKNGSRAPEIKAWNPVTNSTNAVVANENGLNYSGLAYTDAFRANYEYILKLNQKHGQFMLRNVDANVVPGGTDHRSHNIPVQTANQFKVRFRARNLPNLSVPVGYITVAQKSASTTATLTIPNHGLTTSDWIAIVGIRDQANFANLTTATAVASVVDVNTITISFGAIATTTSYGGSVFRVQGQAALPSTSSSAIQSYALTADGNRLSVVFLATPSTPVVGEVWTLYGLVDSTNTPQTALYGRYKVALFNTTTFTLELTPMDGQVISGVSLTPANAGGMLIKNSEFRLHWLRAENETPAEVEVVGGDGNGDFANAIVVTPTSTPNISTVTTVTNLGEIQWGAANVEAAYYSTGGPNSMDAREQQELQTEINFNSVRNGRWTIS